MVHKLDNIQFYDHSVKKQVIKKIHLNKLIFCGGSYFKVIN